MGHITFINRSRTESCDLFRNRSSSVNNSRSEHATVAKLAGLVEDLSSKLTGWANDENQGLSTNRRSDSRDVGCRVWTRRS